MEMELKTGEFKEFQNLIYQESGIKLEDGKEHLIHFRLGTRLTLLGMSQYRTYLDWLKHPEGANEVQHLLDAISTNTTSFFREPAHFDFVKESVVNARKNGIKNFKIWSAASSSGEEPYSLAIALSECALSADTDIKIVASDLSMRVLEHAKVGAYEKDKVEGLPQNLISKYFLPQGEKFYQVRSDIKAMIQFQKQNLLSTPFAIPGQLDFIFLRNVMIYFDIAVKNRIITECFQLLKPGGYLLIGHSETLNGLDSKFKCIKPSYYLKA